jgi:glycerol-3-phosphate dehydrogenase (NAD(P)+)
VKVCVLGAGAWGTALAIHLARKTSVTLWARDTSHVSGMKKSKSNPKYLGDFKFPDLLSLNDNFKDAVLNCDFILSTIPTIGFRKALKDLKNVCSDAPILWANKGLEPSSAKLPFEVIDDEFPSSSNVSRSWGVLSGPSFAAELIRGLPTAVSIATNDGEFSKKIAPLFHHNNMRSYISSDIAGVCVGGALKNVIAIATGISDGMGFGNNARAALITRGLSEIKRFGLKIGSKPETFTGLSGMGDLVLTCTGEYSRNREVGLRLSKGESLQSILDGLGHVAEGVFTAKEVARRASFDNIDMPITHEINNILFQEKPAKEAVLDLIQRPITQE